MVCIYLAPCRAAVCCFAVIPGATASHNQVEVRGYFEFLLVGKSLSFRRIGEPGQSSVCSPCADCSLAALGCGGVVFGSLSGLQGFVRGLGSLHPLEGAL